MENGQIISIHAPPRGAPWRCWEKEPTREEFQFTPLREGRPNGKYCVRNPALDFNSRPSARGDKKAADYGNKAINFNSRPSARGDEKIAKKCEKGLISIHAPPRGATKKAADYGNKAINFNSRPSARGDAL